MSLSQLVCLYARDGSPNAKNDWYHGKCLGHIGIVGQIAEDTLHHSNVAVEHAGDTTTGPAIPFSRLSDD